MMEKLGTEWNMIAPRRRGANRIGVMGASPMRLSAQALGDMAGAIRTSTYDRASLSAGIVHFGVGNFHRAHQAVYLDALFSLGLDHDWAIVGAGVRPADGDMRSKLAEQDYLTTVVEQEAANSTARVVASMIDFVPPGDTSAVIRRLADPSIRIVSLTVTEGGYYIDPASQVFDPKHAEIIADASNPLAPRTVFGLILAGLKARRVTGVSPFTVLSCDNIPGNGHVTRNAVVGLARLGEAELADWIKANVAFPNSMVDRITPVTTDRERAVLQQQFGIVDQWPVFCEEFKQWVIEDHFPAGRPALEKVGVQFVDDVNPFELMKIRILNGGHATIAYPAALLDIEYVHEAMADPLIRAFMAKVEHEEIVPTLAAVRNTNLGDYYRIVEQRFSNPKIADTTRRLCYDGSNRQPKFILATAADRLAQAGSVTGLALVSALWARYCYGETEGGGPIDPNDPHWDRLSALARLARHSPQAWLSMHQIFGSLAGNGTFASSFTKALSSLWSKGVRATLEDYLDA